MREIKFKSYVKDSEGKITSYIWNPFNDADSSAKVQDLVEPGLELLAYGLQFTGLLDKNGKEIYEGDIIENGHQTVSRKGSVVFKDGYFAWSFDELPLTFDEDGQPIKSDWCRIIGNIYENPELLK